MNDIISAFKNPDGSWNWLFIIIGAVLLLSIGGGGGGTDVAPIKVDGYRVLIVEDVTKRGELTADQLEALTSVEVMEYLDKTCVKNGQLAEWRLLDYKADMSNESQLWKDAMQLKHDSLPWVFISNPPKGASSAVVSKTQLLELLRRYK